MEEAEYWKSPNQVKMSQWQMSSGLWGAEQNEQDYKNNT